MQISPFKISMKMQNGDNTNKIMRRTRFFQIVLSKLYKKIYLKQVNHRKLPLTKEISFPGSYP